MAQNNRIKKITRIFEILLVIAIAFNLVFLLVKKETKLEHSDYKILVQESAGSSNYVEYQGYSFPKRGYTLSSYTCDNTATITQNTISKAISFTGSINKCTLKFDISSFATGQTLRKLQELSSKWEVNEGSPDYSKTSPQYKYIDGGFTGSASSSGSVRNQYYTYASSYTFNEETGTYSLVNPQVIRFNSSTNGNTLTNKYIVDPSGSSSSTAANASNLDTIYKVTAYTYILQYTISSIPSSTSSSFVCNDCGIWQTNDDYGTSYYVRGKYDNSYAKFANLYWRIVRINGDESLKLIYDGTSAHSNAQSSSDRYLDAIKFNNNTNDNTYLGYMYGSAGASSYNSAHANTNNSNIKSTLDSLYNEFLSNYDDYISDTIFCNDRSIDTKGGESSNTRLGYGTNSTQYAPRYRIYNTKTPSLICPQKNDAFTVSDTENGNGALTRPVGLITADEASMAGLVYGKEMPNNYLVRGKWFWTMSPSYYGSSVAGLFNVYEDGKISVNSAAYEPQLVPVINLTPESVQFFTGTGTMSDPFIITEDGVSTTPTQTNLPTLTVLQNLNPNITVNSGTPNFANAATTDEGLYSAQDDYGTTYYWRGAATTNYIKFGNWYWRIVRINGDGSLRLIYDGTSPGAASIPMTGAFNSSVNHNKYVGYMYGSSSSVYSEVHSNTNSSNAKQTLDSWYENNIQNTNIENDISDTEFCYDRTTSSGTGTGTDTTYYSMYNRNYNNKTPSLLCSQQNDRYTVDDTDIGNGDLSYPIGLIAEDEVTMSGILYANTNSSGYLYRGSIYWTGTPSYFMMSRAYLGNVMGTGLDCAYASCSNGIIPVINIKNSAIQNMTGSGTRSDPFIVQ